MNPPASVSISISGKPLCCVAQLARQSPAEHVIFLGYGLPESDGKARAFLLKHLRLNKQKRLKIEIVLGEPSFRTARLVATLEQALAHRGRMTKAVRARMDEISQQTTQILALESSLKNFHGPSDLEAYLTGQLDEERSVLREMLADQLKLTVLPQYAQDYMQAFATQTAKVWQKVS